MVSSINSNNTSSFYLINSPSPNIINNENENTKEISTYIFNDYKSIEYLSYKTPRSYPEYISTVKRHILSETISGSALQASKYSLEEYESCKQNYYNEINNFDFKLGFENYMHNLGVSSEKELLTFVPDEEKELAIAPFKGFIYDLATSNPSMTSILHEINHITSSIDFDKIQQIQDDLYSTDLNTSPSITLEHQGKALQNLLNSIEDLSNKELYVKGIDLLVLQLKTGEFSSNLAENYIEQQSEFMSDGGSEDAFKWKYLTENIDRLSQLLTEIDTSKKQIMTKEQTNLSDSFISTKIAASKIAMYQK